MVEVTLERHPLVATAGLVWNTDLPRPLQQILFDTADGVGPAPLAQAIEPKACAKGALRHESAPSGRRR
jgi:hypothetical protein